MLEVFVQKFVFGQNIPSKKVDHCKNGLYIGLDIKMLKTTSLKGLISQKNKKAPRGPFKTNMRK